MSATTAPLPGGAATDGKPASEDKPAGRGKVILWSIVAVWLGGTILFILAYGVKAHKAASVVSQAFSPIDEFRLDTWFKVGPIDFNKGVLYLLIAVAITLGLLLYAAKRLQERPTGRLQVVVEWFYDFTANLTRDNMDDSMARKYFPLIATLFVFILVTNLIGYIPLPVDSSEKFKLFGAHIPSFQIFAADTNVAFPLILALGVWLLSIGEGVRHHGALGYVKGLMPGGVTGPVAPLVFGIEILSTFLRLISLTVRLWANLLAGHLLIAFMGGELGVLVGQPFISWFLLPFGILIFLFEAFLIAGLQAFIFAILTAIYLGDAAKSH